MSRIYEKTYLIQLFKKALKIIGSEVDMYDLSEMAIREINAACDYAAEIFIRNKKDFLKSDNKCIRYKAEHVVRVDNSDQLLDKISLEGVNECMSIVIRQAMYSLISLALLHTVDTRLNDNGNKNATIICSRCGARYKMVSGKYDSVEYMPTCTCGERKIVLID